MSSCNGNCSECGSDCADRKPESLLAELNPNASVKKVIAVVSGKGGVGKSTVTSMLAVAMARRGKRVGVLDADITGPSAPTAFGVTECQGADEHGLYPALTRTGIQVMSINLLLDNPADPVVWRGPVIAGRSAAGTGGVVRARPADPTRSPAGLAQVAALACRCVRVGGAGPAGHGAAVLHGREGAAGSRRGRAP